MAGAADREQWVRVTGRPPSGGRAVTPGPRAGRGVVISTAGLDRLVEVDRAGGSVTVEAGMPVGALHRALAAWGVALAEPLRGRASSVGGAVGRAEVGVAAAVVGLGWMDASGQLDEAVSSAELAVHPGSLGTLGVLTRVTLAVRPAYDVATVTTVLAVADFASRFDELAAGVDYLDAAWLPGTDQVAVRRRWRTGAPPDGRGYLAWAGEHLATRARAALPPSAWRAVSAHAGGMAAAAVRAGLGGGYVERSDRAFADVPMGARVAGEWAVPRDALGAVAVELVGQWGGGEPRLPVEFRLVPAEEGWLSPTYRRASAVVTVWATRREWGPRGTGRCNGPAAVLAAVAGAAGGRPTWSGPLTLRPDARARYYPRWADWQAYRREVDPQGRFAHPVAVAAFGH